MKKLARNPPKTTSHSIRQAVMGVLCAAGALSPKTSHAQIVQQTGIISEIISESSGVAASRVYPGVLWTHNDSGNRPTLFAIRPDGQIVARLTVPGAVMRDWEDIAIGRCPAFITSDSPNCIYIADTGDNFESRSRVQLYILPEPNPLLTGQTLTGRATRIDFSYEDGPTDVEGIAVDSMGLVFLVSKGRRWPVKLYALELPPRPQSRTAGALVATLADTLHLPRVPFSGWVTGAAISPASGRLLLRTYVDIYSFSRNRDGQWVPSQPVCHIGAIEPQGEAIDFIDEYTYVLTSEALFNRAGPIHRVECR